ncbi:hypothetical protein JYK11_24530, partial [Shigella dysenteriae]|nr:hypothetical protein [Shigella dysenteriae]
TQRIVTGYQIKSLSNVHKKIRKQVSVSGFLHSHWIGQLILNCSALPHEGGYEDATKFFTVSLSSDG